MTKRTTCPTCRTPLVSFCPACRGALGGRVVSEKKLEQLRAASQRPRPGRTKRKPETT